MRPAKRLLLVFLVTILAPGLILGGLGLRAFSQERKDAERQLRDTLHVHAENVGHRLELSLQEWQQAVDELARSGSSDPSAWPKRVRDATTSPGAGVVLLGTPDHVQALPPNQLLYELSPSAGDIGPDGTSARFKEAESLRLAKQYEPAAALYRTLLTSREPGERVWALYGLALALEKAGRSDEALRTYRQLAEEPPVRIRQFPSDLLALLGMGSLAAPAERMDAAFRLYQGLVAGRWRLEKSLYEHYSDQAKQWLPQDARTFELAADEERKRAMTLAVEHFIETRQRFFVHEGSAVVAFWRQAPFAAIVLGPRYVRTHLLPAEGTGDLETRTAVFAYGQKIAGESSATDDAVGTYTLQGGLPLQLQVQPADPAALHEGLQRRQNLYLAMLAGLLALLGLGGYLTIHLLRGELAVAQMKSDFVATVSHEFRSPLAGINQLGEMLRDGRIPDEDHRQQYYGMIVTETQRLRRLVENVLDFARMEDGRKQYHFEPVDSTAWLRDLAEDFQAQVAAQGFAIETHIPQGLPAIVGDRETLTTAVNNLLDNAVKYSGGAGTVQLEASANDEGLAIAVRDRGVGIREEDQGRIFEKFYRGGGDLSRQIKGVGLGLNLVQHIVSAHGGRVDVESRPGNGSTFTIHLKAARQAT